MENKLCNDSAWPWPYSVRTVDSSWVFTDQGQINLGYFCSYMWTAGQHPWLLVELQQKAVIDDATCDSVKHWHTGEAWIFSIIITKYERHGEPDHRARQENKTTGRVCQGSIFQEKLHNQSVPESSTRSHSIRSEPCHDTTGNQDMEEPCETQFTSKYSLKGYLKCYPGL